ncbi:MAG: hypothetical protein OXG96_00655 [Acidobacteria bacterium]|nr:hypothetical protein [Acidobacteriota bacterium]
MSKRDEFDHERFEELCALAALGQISAGEYAELRSHLIACEDCQRSRQDYLEILHEHLPLVAAGEPADTSSKVALHESSYRQRFLQRTEHQSSSPTAPTRPGNATRSGVGAGQWSRSARLARYALPVAAGLLVAVLGLSGLHWYWGGERLSIATARVSQLREEISRLNRQISDQSLAGQSPAPVTVAVPDRSGAEMDRLVEELSRAQSQRRRALARLQSQSRKLVETQADADALNRALEEARNSETQLSEKLARVERALKTRTGELEALRKQGATREVTLALQEKQIGELARTVNEQAETIRRDQELLAADRDIRDLLTDRNLRVLYVEDNDPEGERIVDAHVFYAQGRRLIVYAHETPRGGKSLDNFALQAWGGRSSSLTGSPKSLGIFYADARNDKGWILKFDDAEVLSQIDSVFITLEPKEGSLKPGSEPLLYSYLNPDDDLP